MSISRDIRASRVERGIVRVEALGYRCLRYVAQDLGAFQILVGANASGKSTFLDVVGFLGDLEPCPERLPVPASHLVGGT